MLPLFLLAIELALLLRSSRNKALLPFPQGVMLYFIVGQLTYEGVRAGLLESQFLYTWSSMSFAQSGDYVQLLFFSMFMLVFLLSLGIRIDRGSLTSARVDVPVVLVLFSIVIVYSYQILHASLFKDGTLWFTSEYLLQKSPEALWQTWYSGILASAFGPMGMLTIISAGVFYRAGHRKACLFLFPAIIWFFLFELSAHSRICAMFLFIAAFATRIASPQGTRLLSLGFVALGYLTILSVLGGRASYRHGISSLGEYFDNALVGYNDVGLFGPVINLAEGVFSTAELFSREAVFAASYKILSFSPLPSFMDGFNDLRDSAMVRLHEYVPMGAVQETYYFGTIFVVLYFATASLAARLNLIQLSRHMSLAGMFNNILVAGAWYMGLAYPCRTVFRFFMVSIFATIFIEIYRSMKSRSVELVGGEVSVTDLEVNHPVRSDLRSLLPKEYM